jgi:Periplasmic copper-binding protein (NosD)
MSSSTIRNKRSIRTTALLAFSLLAATNFAHAAYYCVATAAALQSALNQSANGGVHNAEDNFIDVVQGTYLTGSVTGNGAFHYYSTGTHALVISGGYTASCATQSRNAALTVLDGRHMTQVLSLSSANGLIGVGQLTLQNGEGGTPGAGLQVNYLASVNADVHVINNIIRDNHSSVDAGGVYVSGAGQYTWVFSNLIAGNSADSQYGAGYVTGYGQFNEIIGNTVTANTSAYHGPNGDPVGGLFCGGSQFCQLYNNIFWNNTTYGIFLGNTGAAMAYNDYGTLGGNAPASSLGDVSVAPKFVNPGAGNYRLGSGSPVRDFSPEHLGQYDLDGHAYPTTGNVDIGAYQHL